MILALRGSPATPKCRRPRSNRPGAPSPRGICSPRHAGFFGLIITELMRTPTRGRTSCCPCSHAAWRPLAPARWKDAMYHAKLPSAARRCGRLGRRKIWTAPPQTTPWLCRPSNPPPGPDRTRTWRTRRPGRTCREVDAPARERGQAARPSATRKLAVNLHRLPPISSWPFIDCRDSRSEARMVDCPPLLFSLPQWWIVLLHRQTGPMRRSRLQRQRWQATAQTPESSGGAA